MKKEFWKREWLVLRDDGLLLRYRRANDATASRVLFAGEFDVAAIDGGGTHGHCVRLSPASLSHGRRTFLFDFFTAAEQRGWVVALRAAAATRAEGGRGDASGRDDILAGPIVAVELRLAAATGGRWGLQLGARGGQEVVSAVEAGGAAEAAGFAPATFYSPSPAMRCLSASRCRFAAQCRVGAAVEALRGLSVTTTRRWRRRGRAR